MVNKDRKWAAEAYLRLSKDKMPLDELMEIIQRPDVQFTTKLTPIDSMIQFMARTGNFKHKPSSGASCFSPRRCNSRGQARVRPRPAPGRARRV